jgi:hypothetical protein
MLFQAPDATLKWVRGFALVALIIAGCQTGSDPFTKNQAAVAQSIASESSGNYYIGRRFYRRYFFFWGYVRRPRQPWSQAQLVMVNEQKLHAPDREQNAIGSDNGYEYRLAGYFSGERVYEPASNSFYPEFVLTGYKLVSSKPPPIFRDSTATDPGRIAIDRPE